MATKCTRRCLDKLLGKCKEKKNMSYSFTYMCTQSGGVCRQWMAMLHVGKAALVNSSLYKLHQPVSQLWVKVPDMQAQKKKKKSRCGEHLQPASQAQHLVTSGLNEIACLKETSLRAIEKDTQWCKPLSSVCREMNTNECVTCICHMPRKQASE